MSLSFYKSKLQYYSTKINTLSTKSFQILLDSKKLDEIKLILNDFFHLVDGKSFNLEKWKIDEIFELYNVSELTRKWLLECKHNIFIRNVDELRKYKEIFYLVSSIETNKEMFDEIFVFKNFDIHQFTNLYSLDLSRSEITELPNLSTLHTVKELVISDNYLKQDRIFDNTTLPNNLVEFRANNIFKTGNYDYSIIRNLPYLRNFEYNDNYFREDDENNFKNLPNLRYLSLYNHRMRSPSHILYNLFICKRKCTECCTCIMLYYINLDSYYDDFYFYTYKYNIIDFTNVNAQNDRKHRQNSFNFTDYLICLKRKINKLKDNFELERLQKFYNEITNDNRYIVNLEKIEQKANDSTYVVDINPNIPDLDYSNNPYPDDIE